jgi:hypothetical protein
LPDTSRPAVHVRENLAGWWDVTMESDGAAGDERKLAQYTSEFQAREAGRVNALHLEADLVIHQAFGPTLYHAFDDRTGALSEPSADRPRPA